jgi:hypothetical protein
MTSTDPVPSIIIMENRTLIELAATITIKNPLNQDLDAILIHTNMTLETKPVVTSDFNLSMNLIGLSLQVDSVRTLFKQVPLVKPDKVTQTLNTFIEPLRLALNKELKKSSFKLPLPEILNLNQITSGSPSVLVGDGFYLIQADVKSKEEDNSNDESDN